MADPREWNCQGFNTDAQGRVTGVYLEYVPVPSARYELVRAELIDEAAARGNTVAIFTVLDAMGLPTAEKVYLAWPWPALDEGRLLPGNQDGQHMIINGYSPPELGPLAMYVGDSAGEVISDMIGGLGLPDNHHVSFRLTWKERGAVDPETPGDGGSAAGVAALERIASALERLAAHLGA